MATTIFHPSVKRGHADHGWLQADFSFSFAGWQDPSRIHFGALRVLNDDVIATEVGFPEHPHSNMEIISIVLKGALSHKDSMGNVESIYPNEVQVMSAGSGLYHSEFNDSKTEAINSLQIWIFPKEKNITPRYEQKKFNPDERKNQLQMLVAPMDDANGEALKINQDAWIYRTNIEAGKSITHPLKPGNGLYIFMLEGSASAEGQLLNRRDALGVSDTDSITITANDSADILLLEVPMEF